MLMTTDNKPSTVVLLVQKEVAQRLAAKPGDMSLLSVSAQVYADVFLGEVVRAELFTPPPKVDSQIVIMKTKSKTIFENCDENDFFRVVKAGFSSKRKKLRSSMAGGLNLSKSEIEQILKKANINPDSRAESLAIDDWFRLASVVTD